MPDKDVNYLQNIYKKYLEIINGVKFTRREIDIVACVSCGWSSKKIATLLPRASKRISKKAFTIDPKTVDNHIHNIMIKVGCNSRDSIIGFVEKANKLPILRKYYENLLIQTEFEKCLKDISQLQALENTGCFLTYWNEKNRDESLITFLDESLKSAGIVVFHEIKEEYLSPSHLFSELEEEKKYICILPSEAPVELKQSERGPHELPKKVIQCPKNTVFLLPKRKNGTDASNDFLNFNFVGPAIQNNCYLIFFQVLTKLFPYQDIQRISSRFFEKYEATQVLPIPDSQPTSTDHNKVKERKGRLLTLREKGILANKTLFLLSGIFFLILVVSAFLFMRGNDGKENKSISKQPHETIILSDLSIPAESHLLHRPEVLSQIDKELSKQEGIQTLALVGPGGAGKTTLARQYAHSQKAPVVWEINAETKETLERSFENLAESLSKTEENQKTLRSLRDIKDLKEKAAKILHFVKNHLKSHPQWVLLFDNMEKPADVQNYLPYDVNTWGQGKVLLTSRDGNIQNNKNINFVVQLGELKPQEALCLFTKIHNNGSQNQRFLRQRKEIEQFLSKIPLFPLDVSVSAYYLKATNVSYDQYLRHLTNFSNDFESINENILKETSAYTKTRYNIISLSLKKLIEAHKDFEELLLLISLLDSQDIPRDLLAAYKGEAVVDNFIYHLKKYSLITTKTLPSSPPLVTLSLHRSTQAIILTHFTRELALEKNKLHLQPLARALESYITLLSDNENFQGIKNIVRHCESFISKNGLLTKEIKTNLQGSLGCIRYYLCEYIESKKLLENNLLQINCKNSAQIHLKAHMLLCLGIINWELSNIEKAKNLIEKSLSIYRNYFPEKKIGEAKALAYLGTVFRELGQYKKAMDLQEESVYIYQKYFPKNYAGLAWVLMHLGNTYMYLNNSHKAKALIEKSFLIYRDNLGNNHPGAGWSLTYLGGINRKIGDFKQAKVLYQKALSIFKNHFPEEHFDVAWTLTHLGYIEYELGNYVQAKQILEKSLSINRRLFGETNNRVAWVLSNLGIVYNSLGEYTMAKQVLEESFAIYKRKTFPDSIAWVLALQGDVDKNLGQYEKGKVKLEKSLGIRKKYLSGDLTNIGKTYFLLCQTHNYLGNSTEAKKFCEESIQTYESVYGKSHLRIAPALTSLAQAFLLEENYEKAAAFANDALVIFQKNNHPEIYTALETLSAIHLKKYKKLSIKNSQKERGDKNKAINYLNQALDVIKASFPENSIHITRIQSKLRSLEGG